MLSRLPAQLERSLARLQPWLGERLGIRVSAFGLSLLGHLLLLVLVGSLTYAVRTNVASEIRSGLLEHSLDEFARLEPTEVLAIDESLAVPVAGSFSPQPRPLMLDTVPESARSETGPSLAAPDVSLAARLTLPPATRLDQNVVIRGSGAEHVGDTEGAVDRIAVEILRRLERGRTLVVWAFDASGSLQAERKRLAGHIGRVYQHINELDRDGLAADGALRTAVIAFGKDRRILAEPTSDPSAIVAAIEVVPLDSTGFESTFQTVGEIARRFGSYEEDGHAYQCMAVVVTDEVGDDEASLEAAIAAARAAEMPVYVLGSPALFGRVEGFMDYNDPATGRNYQNLPVRAGPETVVPEVVRLPFWYAGPQYEFLDAGFGPWALSRLARQTGGIYFIARLGAARLAFDPAGMREYAPDWESREEVMAQHARRPLRQAVMRAAAITQQNLPGMPSLQFPAADSPDFKEAMARNQEIVARVQYTVDEALAAIAPVEKERDRESSRRWRAHYDLVRGRLLAVKLRCFEYNAACGRMKRDMPKFSKPENNAWILVPDTEIRSGEKAAAAAVEAEELLARVVKEHAGTPWGLLADRELKDPFGFRWVETYVRPPDPGPEPDPGQRRNMRENRGSPPPPPPKL